MGIRLNWDDQSDQNLDAIEIYRGLSAINPNDPGTPLVSLPGTAIEYEDTTVQNGNTYHYCVAVVKGTDRSFAENQQVGYYANLGPGAAVPLRGDWVRGYFGEIMNADWVTPVEVVDKIKLALKTLTGITFTTTSDRWYKFIYKGKVFFAPTTQLMASTWQNAYNAGFLFGEDGVGALPTGAAGAVNQKTVIELGGNQFLVRPIRMTDKPTTQYLTSADDFFDGEWKSTYVRLRADANAITDPMIRPRFCDLTTVPPCAGPHLATATTVASVNGTAVEVIASTAIATSVNWMIVLELIP